ncbi:MAG: hypothetical protein RR100_26755, partial [Comamonas sp.]
GVMRSRSVHSPHASAAALPLRRWLTAWLLLALLVAPLVARMHQVVHMPGMGTGAAAAVSAAWLPQAAAAQSGTPQNGEAASQSVAPAVLALFGHHGSLECQALDQLAHGQAPLFHLPWLPASWAAAVSLAAPVHVRAAQRWWAPLARGPPAQCSAIGF